MAGQNASFQQQITTLQSSLSSINQLNDKRTSERLSEYKEVFGVKEKILNSRIVQLENDIEVCETKGTAAMMVGKDACDGYHEMVKYVSYIKQQEVSILEDLSSLHKDLYSKKSDYLYDQAECNKKGNQGGNICEIASSKKGKVEAIESEIETKRVYLEKLNDQLLKLSGVF